MGGDIFQNRICDVAGIQPLDGCIKLVTMKCHDLIKPLHFTGQLIDPGHAEADSVPGDNGEPAFGAEPGLLQPLACRIDSMVIKPIGRGIFTEDGKTLFAGAAVAIMKNLCRIALQITRFHRAMKNGQ